MVEGENSHSCPLTSTHEHPDTHAHTHTHTHIKKNVKESILNITEDVAQLVVKSWVLPEQPHKPGMVVQTCDPSTQEGETEGSEVQDHPLL